MTKLKTTAHGTEVIIKALKIMEVYAHREDWVTDEDIKICKNLRRSITHLVYKDGGKDRIRSEG